MKRIQYVGTMPEFSIYAGDKQFTFKLNQPQELDDKFADTLLKRADFKVAEAAKPAPAPPAKKAGE